MTKIPYFLISVFVCTMVAISGCTSLPAAPVTPTSTMVTITTTITPVPTATLVSFDTIPESNMTASEREDALYLQEAEKAERDINEELADQRQTVTVFRSIADIVTVAMTADNVILERYNLPNPEKQAVGKFTSPKLQRMYDDAVSAGSLSVTGAITASMKYDDLHIADLMSAIGRTDNDDLKFIYEQELALSRNNMRLLHDTLKEYGGTYVPTYITPAYYNEIITTPAEPVQLVQ